MNKSEAKRLSDTASLEEIKQTLRNAKAGIINWEERASLNKSMTKGAAFNILTIQGKLFEYTEAKQIRGILAYNILREFGDFFPGYEKQIKKDKDLPKPFHQEPIQINKQ